jgi:uncharacterized CHY-type Zn-finger protein
VLDDETRCAHWNGPTDVIAIRFKCCDRYYPCFSCHEEAETHDAARWERAEFGEPGVLCGVCHTELTIADYLAGGFTCPSCGAGFNPGCALHHHLYFALDE